MTKGKKIGLGIVIIVVALILIGQFCTPASKNKKTLQSIYPEVVSYNPNVGTKVINSVNYDYGILKYSSMNDSDLISLCKNVFPKVNDHEIYLENASTNKFDYSIIYTNKLDCFSILKGDINQDLKQGTINKLGYISNNKITWYKL